MQSIGSRWLSCLVLGWCLSLPALAQAETDRLVALLHEFMAGASVNDVAMHERFWSEELVYTSSSGARFGKAEILAALESPGELSGVVYTAEDIDVRLHDEVAVVTFRLVARRAGQQPEEFYNTGVFTLHGGAWQAVAWQATRIPSAEQHLR
jgi:hypothetical protein